MRGRSEAGGGSLFTTLATSEFVVPQFVREAVPQAREVEGRREKSASTNFFGSRGAVLGGPDGGAGKRRGRLPTQWSEREEGNSGSRGRLRSAAARQARLKGDTMRKRSNAVTNAALSLNDAMGTKAGIPASPVLTSAQVGAVRLEVLFSRSPRSSLTASCEVPRCMVCCNCRLAVVNTLGPKTPRAEGRARVRARARARARMRATVNKCETVNERKDRENGGEGTEGEKQKELQS